MTNSQSDDKYTDYLTRAQLVTATGYEVAQVRGLYDAPGADAYFGAVRVKGQFLYPPESVAMFRDLLSAGVTKKAFTGIIATAAQRGGVGLGLVTPDDSSKGDIATLRQSDKTAIREFILEPLAEVLASRILPAEDHLLTRKQVKEKLGGGAIPRTLVRVAKSPDRWRNSDVNAYIASL